MRVLVAGGAGYIGSHAVRQLLKAGHEVSVLDDLSHGQAQAVAQAAQGLGREARLIHGSIANRPQVVQILRDARIEAVLHFAALIEVAESVSDPAKYYRNNFSGSLELLEAMREADVHRLVFSSTAAVYGNPKTVPILEDAPCEPINPYGRSKRMVELVIQDFAHAYGLGFAILRYFNVAGASPDGVIGEAHDPESHLIPRVLDAALGQAPAIRVFGTDYETRDGTCVRDYIHVEDLVEAHILAMEAIRPGNGAVYNLGSENGFSVREVIRTCEQVTRRTIPVEEGPRRPGDPATLIASSQRIRQALGWKRRYPELETMVRHAWEWHQKRRTPPRPAIESRVICSDGSAAR